MPKMHKDFPAQLSLSVTKEMKQKLVAIGYMLGTGGGYAVVVRNLLAKAIKDYIGSLQDDRKMEFDAILNNVMAREILHE